MTKTVAFYVKLLFFIYIAAILLLCFLNFSFPKEMKVPLYIMGIPIDKAVHFMMFAPFPVLFFMAFPRIGIFLCCVMGLLFASCTEFVQNYFLPYRDGDVFDFFADIVGIMVGLICLLIVRRKYSRQPDASPTRQRSE